MTGKNYDWTYFKRRIYINNSSAKELFRKWATPGGITEWFIEFATYESKNGAIRKPDEVVQKGDKYKWIFHKGSTVDGVVLDVVETERESTHVVTGAVEDIGNVSNALYGEGSLR